MHNAPWSEIVSAHGFADHVISVNIAANMVYKSAACRCYSGIKMPGFELSSNFSTRLCYSCDLR